MRNRFPSWALVMTAGVAVQLKMEYRRNKDTTGWLKCCKILEKQAGETNEGYFSNVSICFCAQPGI